MTINAKCCGWEPGAGAAWGPFSAGGSADAAAARTGAYGLQLLASASSPNGEFQLAPAAVDVAVGQVYFRFPSLPGARVFVMQWRSSGSAVSGYRLIFDSADNTIRLAHYDSTGTLEEEQTGPVIAAGAWNRLDFALYGSNGAPGRQMDWQINGAAQTTVGPNAGFISGVNQWRMGWTAAQTYTMHVDDVLLVWAGGAGDEAEISGAYPLPAQKVLTLGTDGVGTHSGSGSFGASAGTLADSWQILDNVPMNTEANYVEQTTIGAGDYLEYTFEDLPPDVETIYAVQVYFVRRSSTLAANNAKLTMVDGANTPQLYNAGWLDNSSPYTLETDAIIPDSGVGSTHEWRAAPTWTPSRVNALLGRWGFSSDVDGIPRLPAFRLEVSVADVPVVREEQTSFKWGITQHPGARAVLQSVTGQISGDQISALLAAWADAQNAGYSAVAKAGTEEIEHEPSRPGAWGELFEVTTNDPGGVLGAAIHFGEDTTPSAAWAATRRAGIIAAEIGAIGVKDATVGITGQVGDPTPAPTTPTGPVARPRELPAVRWEIDGLPVDVAAGWQANEVAHDFLSGGSQGGFDRFTGKIPERQYRRRRDEIGPGARIVGRTDDDVLVWEGTLRGRPEVRDGVANLEAWGDQHRLRGLSGRLLFESRDYGLWVPYDSEPHEYPSSAKYDVETGRGRLMFVRSAGDYGSNQGAGLLVWVPGAVVRYIEATVHRDGIGPSWTLELETAEGPSGARATDRQWNVGNLTSGETILKRPDGEPDLVGFRLGTNQAVTNADRGRLWLTGVRVRDIARSSDEYTTSEVVAEIGGRGGFETDGVEETGRDALPFDLVEGDWMTAGVEYMALLDDWVVRVSRTEGVTYTPWGSTEWLTSRQTGARDQLQPRPQYSHARVAFDLVSGAPDEVVIEADPNPYAGTGEEHTWSEDLSDPQHGRKLATDVATLLAERGSALRYGGTVEITQARRSDGTGHPYAIRAGDVNSITDWGDSEALTHRVHEVVKTGDRVILGSEQGVSASRRLALADLRASRRRRRGGR